MAKIWMPNPLTTLACGVIHFLGAFVLYYYFLAPESSSGHIGFLNAYVAKARGMFYELFSFRAVILAGVFGSGTVALYGLIGVLIDQRQFQKLAVWTGMGLFVYSFLMLAGYLANPNYLDAGESHVTMLSLLLKDGKPIYSELDNPDLANTWYGPVLFIVNAAFLLIVPDPILATKLRGIIGLMAGFWLFFHFASKRYGKTLVWIGSAYIILTLFLAFFFAVGNRADSLIIAFSLAAAAGATLGGSRRRMWMAAICMAAAVNCKVTAAAYMFPIGAYIAVTYGWKPALQTTFLAMGLFFVPFLVFSLFPLNHYMAYIMMATDNAFERALLLENIGFSLFLMFPFLWVFVKCRGKGGDVGKDSMVATGITLFALAVVSLTASKEGSGFYHLLAFAPGLALLWIHFTNKLGKELNISIPGGLAGVSWVLGCLLLTLGGNMEFLYGFKLRGGQNPGTEIRQIIQDYPGKRIAMGYGQGNDYSDTRLFYRPLLYKTTRNNPMNAVTMIEFYCSKQPIPQSAIERFGNRTYDLFLIPKEEEPFSNNLFEGLGIAETFGLNYVHLEDRNFFGVWEANFVR